MSQVFSINVINCYHSWRFSYINSSGYFFNYSCVKMHASKANNCEMGWHEVITQVLNGRPAHKIKLSALHTFVERVSYRALLPGFGCPPHTQEGTQPRAHRTRPVHAEPTSNWHQTCVTFCTYRASSVCAKLAPKTWQVCPTNHPSRAHVCGGSSFFVWGERAFNTCG